MKCQSTVNCNSQVCWRQVNLQDMWLQNKDEGDDEFDGSDMKMTTFGYRVDLIRERHVRVKDYLSQDLCEQRN